MRDTPDLVAARIDQCLQGWVEQPWQFDYFAVMRRLEATAASTPRWGLALLPNAEPVRVGQEPSLIFAPAAISHITRGTAKAPPVIRQRFLGYLGPNGPLPVHLNEFVHERVHNAGDPTLLAFLDGFNHRFALHFYRAWAQARPAVSLDRPAQDRFRNQVGSLIGQGSAARQQRDGVQDDARLHFAGHLVRQIRNTESLQAVVQAYFGAPVQVEPWAGRWMRLPESETTRLGRGTRSRSLGQGAVLGRTVWDRQHQVHLRIGPLDPTQFAQFLPNGAAPPVLRAWMRQLLGDEFNWDATLVLHRQHVPQAALGQSLGRTSHLGWTSWLGGRPRQRHAADVRIYRSASG